VALVHELNPAGAEQWVFALMPRGKELGQSWPFRIGPSCRSLCNKLILKQKPTGSTVIPKIVQDPLNEHLFTGAVVDNIEEEMAIEGMQEELELEAGPPLKPAMLVAPPTKRSQPNVSTIYRP